MGEKLSKPTTKERRPPPMAEIIRHLAKEKGLDVEVTDTDDGGVKVTMDTAAGRTVVKIGHKAKSSSKPNKARPK